MVEVDGKLQVIGPRGPLTLLEAFEGRRQLIAYYFMWHTGHPAPEQCEGCTWVTTQVRELSYLHSRDITFAVFCQGPYDESGRYRDFMGWQVPWYSASPPSTRSSSGARSACSTSSATSGKATSVRNLLDEMRGAEVMDYSYALMDLTVYGRQEKWEDSPPGWPQQCTYTRTNSGPPSWHQSGRADAQSPSGPAWRPDVRMTWEPAGIVPVDDKLVIGEEMESRPRHHWLCERRSKNRWKCHERHKRKSVYR